jgi:flavin reductase (DIM6/NTAB) family NADH-FMN oxidoreductase RutF
MVSCSFGGISDIITVAWTGTVCTNPAMVSISVRPERYSYELIKNSGEFVINLTTKRLAHAMDFCGVRSGRDLDKWKEMHLTKLPGEKVEAPLIAQSPVNIECKVEQCLELGSHHMFLARVEGVHVDRALLDKNGKLCLEKAGLVVYSHGIYYDLGKMIGSFGYSVKK